MKENILLFITYFDDYLDVCLNLNTEDKFDSIRNMKNELKLKRNKISLEEYNIIETDIFYEYLKLLGIIS